MLSSENVAQLVGNCSYITCCMYYQAPCMYWTRDDETDVMHYTCEECYRTHECKLIPANDILDYQIIDTDGENYNVSLDFNLVRKFILSSRRKFENVKAALDVYGINYESEGYTIPQIYEDLKKNYSRPSDYIMYKLSKK
jgi:hypothetical protein